MSAHIAGNTVLRVGLLLPVAQSRVGILVTASDRAHVSDNEVSNVGPVGDFVGPSVGIVVLTPFSGVDVSGNLARRFSPELGVKTVDKSDWTPLLILGLTAAQTDRTFIANAGRFETTFVRTSNPVADNLSAVFKLAPAPIPIPAPTPAPTPTPVPPPAAAPAARAPEAPPIRVAARGNQLEGFGSQAVALIYGGNDCVFTDNHCALETPANQTVNNADVVLAGLTVIASGNRITGGAVAMSIAVPSTAACSVLGNLTRGSITVDAPPWPRRGRR